MVLKLSKIFDAVKGNTIFKEKFVLQANFLPENIKHREEYINQIASILAPSLRGDRISNLFLYGNTGTGKTLSIQYVKSELLKRGSSNLGFKLRVECKSGRGYAKP